MQNYIKINNTKHWIRTILWGGFITLSFTSCNKIYNLPEDRDFISDNISYNTKEFFPILGRNNTMGSINLDNSSLPVKFEIVNARYGDGRKVEDLFQVRPTYRWIDEYDGKETSLEEIEKKRVLENRPLMEVDSVGRFILHSTATNDLITPRSPDSSLLTQDLRYFDLKITNTGGVRYVRDFFIAPWFQREYDPSNDINPYTGGVAPDPASPRDPRRRDYITPTRLNNVLGEVSNIPLVNNNEKKDVVVYIRRFQGGDGKKLRFVFLDKDENPINPLLFNETRWDKLVHGFNMNMTNQYVEFDVAYPIPLTSFNTEYVSGGRARVNFIYSRVGFGGGRTTSTVGLDFSIYQAGDWEIVFHFRNENPRFGNEQ